MKLDQVVLTNFRCFKNESIALDRYVALVGSNNCGKSTVLKAIDLFFRSNQKASPIALDDFNDVNAELKISLTFSDLSKKSGGGIRTLLSPRKARFFYPRKGRLRNCKREHSWTTSGHGRFW